MVGPGWLWCDSSVPGEFTGYLISYRPRDTSPQDAQEVRLQNPQAKVTPCCLSFHHLLLQSHTLEDLSVFTQYLVSLRVYNPEGAGPDTIVVVMTDEGG